MFHRLIITCGTSFNSADNLFHTRNLPLDDRQLTEQGRLQLDQWIFGVHTKIRNLDIADVHKKLSAEFSAVYELSKQRRITKNPEIILILTETVGGRVAGRLLTKLFQSFFHAEVTEQFFPFDVSNECKINQQLSEYLTIVSNNLVESDPGSCCFIPLGGYKLMVAYGYLIGSFCHFPSYYLYEAFQKLIEVPAVPINVDNAFIGKYAPLLKKFKRNRVFFLDELSAHDRNVIQKYGYFFTQDDHMIALSPFGLYLIRQSSYHYILRTEFRMLHKTAGELKKDHLNLTFAYQQLYDLAKQLKTDGKMPDALIHEKTFKLDPHRPHYHIYKGISHSNSVGVLRAAYDYRQKEDVVYIGRIWFDHQKYQTDLDHQRGIYFDDSADQFVDITKDLYSLTEGK